MKKLSLIFAMVLCIAATALAQRTITGTVTDGSESLISVNIVVKGTTIGTTTDIDGKYSISVPEGSNVLVFSYTGYQTQEVELGASNVVDVIMSEGVTLTNVVVTALGLKADPDKQGTASSQVGGQKVVNSGETGLIQGLSGKASSVAITKNSGDPGAGAYIQIRGQSTITGDLQPLIVVDGMPMYNSSVNTEANTAGVVEQSRINDINPDDIESVQVLKGAAAAAQWGTRAANGVIIITTKSGSPSRKKGFNLNFRSTLSFDQVSITHPLQESYGQGLSGNWIANNALNWGDRIDQRPGGADVVDQTGAYFEAEDGTRYYPIIEKRSRETFNQQNFDQVFRTGYFTDNSLSISGGDDKGSFFASFAHLDQQGIINGNSDYTRTNFRINADRRLGDDLKLSVNTSYAKIKSNRIQHGSNLNGLYLGYLRTVADFDNTDYTGAYVSASGVRTERAHRAYRDYLGSRIVGGLPIGPVYNNPGWTINDQENTTDVDRITVGSELSYDPTSWLNLTGRVGVDAYTDDRFTLYPVGSAAGLVALDKNTIQESQVNVDVFARASKSFSADFSINALVGMNFNQRDYSRIGGYINSFILPYAPANLDNATAGSSITSDFESVIRTAAAYATVSLDFYDQIFVNLTGRQESASTFGTQAENSFFYPSASLAWQFSKILNTDGGAFSFGKLRLAYGEVGVQPPVYSSQTLFALANLQESWGPQIQPGDYGTGSYVPSNRQGNPLLQPERKTEFEAGVDLRFVQDKIAVSFTYYQNQTTGAIFAVDVPASTGFLDKLDNAATIENRGFEFDVTAQVVRSGDFSFDLGMNLFRNRNNVVDLQGVESIFLNGFTGSSSRAVEGEQLGALWGGKWARDDAGNMILNENGFPTVAASEGILGDPNPDWRGGLNGTLGYKGFGLSFLFETSQGNDMWFGTEGVLRYFGRSIVTDVPLVEFSPTEAAATPLANGFTVDQLYSPADDGNYYVRGSYEDFGGGDVFLDQWWYLGNGGGFGPVGEQFVSDASWTRLREVALSYRLDSKGFRDATKLGALEISLTGRNLIIWTDAVGIDPETNLTGTSNGRGLDYFTNPGTRSYLITLKLTY